MKIDWKLLLQAIGWTILGSAILVGLAYCIRFKAVFYIFETLCFGFLVTCVYNLLKELKS